jgi:hypothetical protein
MVSKYLLLVSAVLFFAGTVAADARVHKRHHGYHGYGYAMASERTSPATNTNGGP